MVASVSSSAGSGAAAVPAVVSGPGEPLTVIRLPVLSDNYIWLLHEPTSGVTAVVDPAEAAPVEEALKARCVTLCVILLSFSHAQCVTGVY